MQYIYMNTHTDTVSIYIYIYIHGQYSMAYVCCSVCVWCELYSLFMKRTQINPDMTGSVMRRSVVDQWNQCESRQLHIAMENGPNSINIYIYVYHISLYLYSVYTYIIQLILHGRSQICFL